MGKMQKERGGVLERCGYGDEGGGGERRGRLKGWGRGYRDVENTRIQEKKRGGEGDGRESWAMRRRERERERERGVHSEMGRMQGCWSIPAFKTKANYVFELFFPF